MWTQQGEAPLEYVNYVLMRHVFRCLPDELRRQSIADIQAVLVCMEVETQVKEYKQTVRQAGAK